ncbi:MAG: ribonuclease III [Alphaproteobacteria bacterium]|nr:ribonuclease III [Alphaproteobacteria bacterium]
MSSSLRDLEKTIGHQFRNPALLETALTHSSTGMEANYERLEFLGDRVVGLIVAEMLYRHFPAEAEGDLAKRLAALVQGKFLALIAVSINLQSFVILSDAERTTGGADNENILSDVFEALVGALYLDGGFKPCQTFVEQLWAEHLHTMITPPQHPKTTLQEWAQAQGLPLPLYEIAAQEGPDHAPLFRIRLRVQGHPEILAEGPSRQAAERQAARNFLERLEQTK